MVELLRFKTLTVTAWVALARPLLACASLLTW